MWRRVDFHTHTQPDTGAPDFSPESYVQWALAAGLDVVGVTDHMTLDRVEPIVSQAHAAKITVIPGVEIDTDRGHVLALAPGPDWADSLRGLMDRVGAPGKSKVNFRELVERWREKDQTGTRRLERIVLIGAHADRSGSLLGGGQTFSVEDQALQAAALDGIEVVDDSKAREWQNKGIKGTAYSTAVVRGSDSHFPAPYFARNCWMYLPDVTASDIRHALATRESSIEMDETRPLAPDALIKAVSFSGGRHHGEEFVFADRCTALIGPPLSGKSLVVDSLRWVFGVPHTLPDIERVSEARLNGGLGVGTTVRVTVAHGGAEQIVERTYGGGSAPDVPFKPIVFSQAELVAQAMEPEPAMSLLDLHVAGSRRVKRSLEALGTEINERLVAAMRRATRVAELRSRLVNPEDGLQVIRDKVAKLGGSESLAQRAVDLSQLKAWRARVATVVTEWRSGFEPDSGPELPASPVFGDGAGLLSPFVPSDALVALRAAFASAVGRLADDFAGGVTSAIAGSQHDLEVLEQRLDQELAEQGIAESGEHLTALRTLRQQLDALEQDSVEFEQLRTDLLAEAASITQVVDDVMRQRLKLRELRKTCCTEVNVTMQTFRCRLNEDARTEQLDELIESAKVGTRFQEGTLVDVRNTLDRKRLVEDAIHLAMGEEVDPPDELRQQVEIARVVASRSEQQMTVLGRLVGYWPGDALLMERNADGMEFRALSEGLKALAIKEISFASSDRPVITDQPEDAVTPSAVFDNLVPTLRIQRRNRQFIVASHDANIVVAGDVERIIVLDPSGKSRPGTLADSRIRDDALQLLEGGELAFRRRADRYEDF